MRKLLCLFAILTFTSSLQSDGTEKQGDTFQALKKVEGGYNIGDWDGSTILNSKGEVLTTVSVKANMLDFSHPASQSRSELLVTLYKAGVRRVNYSMEDFLVLNTEGRIGPPLSQGGFFQALKEREAGYDVRTFGESSLLDSKGTVLATVVSHDQQARLSFGPQQSLETLYDLGLRTFLTEPRGKWILVKDDRGMVTLRKQ